MPSPFDYMEFRRLLIQYGISDFGFPLIEMSLLWTFYLYLHNPLLFSVIAVGRPLVRTFSAPIGGMISDKYEKWKGLMIFKNLTVIAVLGVIFFLITNNIILAIIIFYLRIIVAEISNTIGHVSFSSLLPRNMLKDAYFYAKVVGHTSSIISQLSWFILYQIQVFKGDGRLHPWRWIGSTCFASNMARR
ncbi:hypothetical protein [Acidianus brierleyi]|uniref:Major facilitator superfamily (MFS) profile domain-containing protein n=1 Tax=Acidianus brierleyi TaxID=41673 RepID=A0A2U9IDJ8_9CREN|nr:hypothetical protein [Acidianus brierleyi]AWR94069.1 hypothetical protein DFR85_05115 [Acidianus brierleyi]